MRISDWSSEVCSSDLTPDDRCCGGRGGEAHRPRRSLAVMLGHRPEHPGRPPRWRPWALGSAAEGDERRGCEGRASARKNESKTRTWALPSRFLNHFGILDSFSLDRANRSEEHTSELQSLLRSS